MLGRRRAFAAACAALVLATLAAVGLGASHSDGMDMAARTGCGPETGCHGVPGLASPLVRAKLEGLPVSYEPGKDYGLTVHIEGAPPGLPTAKALGGFAAEASNGTFWAPDANEQANGTHATHTSQGSGQHGWGLIWTAPPAGAGEVTFYLSANAVDGNGAADPGDLWNMAAFHVPEGPSLAPPPVPAPTPAPAPHPAEGPGVLQDERDAGPDRLVAEVALAGALLTIAGLGLHVLRRR